ncbi:hypothetical protein H2201_003076 [Coniosporium apollinis]|uniref:Pentatricopeptide repeat-containing protein-mitochondrial domain-containing protein n=1 Tax=Coniosporium apollinis TaxID=61459 RepID=A0ABQ9NXW1_9PEZI|nr:hypothetical protein H2201_003076 [Coniosporium apollinis]
MFQGHFADTKKLVEFLVVERNERPNAKLFSALILANVDPVEGSAADVGALLSELRAEGLEPDAGALAVHPDYILRSEILDFMRQRWFTLSSAGHHDVMAGLLREHQYEMALDRLDQMLQEGRPTQAWLLDMAVYLLAEAEEIDEALRIMQQRNASGTAISASLWYHLLDKASSVFHVKPIYPPEYPSPNRAALTNPQYPATLYTWRRRVEPSYLNPPTGICLNVLTTASRAGDAQLATDVFRVLGNRGTVFDHTHYEALIETYIAASDLKTALSVLSIMAAANVVPDEGSTRPIFRYLRELPGGASEAFEILKALRESERIVPTAALNVVLEACIHHGELAEAIEAYKTLHLLCAQGPDTGTFNILLKGCNAAGRKDLAMFLAAEMNALSVKPDTLTYDRLLLACLKEEDYEDAMRYYDEMRAQGWVPRQGTFNAVVKRCAEAGDMRAWEVLGDMRDLGMAGERIQSWLEANWKGGRPDEEEGVVGYGGQWLRVRTAAQA